MSFVHFTVWQCESVPKGKNLRMSLLLLVTTDKFKGGRADLNQTKSCIDLDELMELLKARGTEK